MNAADAQDAPITAENLVKRFGAFTAVDHVSFRIARGEIVGFLGPNGAGKSTTIRMLCGLLRPSEGRANVAGFDIMREPERVREHIGYMSQKFSLYGDLTVAENLRFFGGLYRVPRDVSRRWPVAGSSAWPWAAPFCTGRRSCSSTSRPRASIPNPAAGSGT
jgi:ABC-2 type transport system ATP-binding protein